MLVKHSEPMKVEYMKEHCRYKIWQHTEGQFGKALTVAYCDTVVDAKRLCAALNEYSKADGLTYEYELCAEFIEIKDVAF